MAVKEFGQTLLIRSTISGAKIMVISFKLQAPSSEKNNPQASSPKHKGSSFKPEAASSRTADPE
jgi:hypothetical protein